MIVTRILKVLVALTTVAVTSIQDLQVFPNAAKDAAATRVAGVAAGVAAKKTGVF
jgi:hypothetical protein